MIRWSTEHDGVLRGLLEEDAEGNPCSVVRIKATFDPIADKWRPSAEVLVSTSCNVVVQSARVANGQIWAITSGITGSLAVALISVGGKLSVPGLRTALRICHLRLTRFTKQRPRRLPKWLAEWPLSGNSGLPSAVRSRRRG